MTYRFNMYLLVYEEVGFGIQNICDCYEFITTRNYPYCVG